jgi:RNA polymerase sigma-70 factor (ECF subfamily)
MSREYSGAARKLPESGGFLVGRESGTGTGVLQWVRHQARSAWVASGSAEVGGETVPIRWAEEPDAVLMDRVRAGDDRALELLVHRWTPRLAAFFYRLTGRSSDVDDLVQSTFVRIFTARSSWIPGAHFGAWIHTIARRLSMDRARSRARKPLFAASRRPESPEGATTLLGRIPDDAPTPFSAVSRLELVARLEEALRTVPEPFRETVVLCDLQQLSYEDAAAVLGCPVKTVSSRLARGREALREAMAAYRSGPIS